MLLTLVMLPTLAVHALKSDTLDIGQPTLDDYTPIPQYDAPAATDRPDHRTTLYWNPKVEPGTTVRFYASDVSKRYLVTLEGVSSDGTVIHYQQVIQ